LADSFFLLYAEKIFLKKLPINALPIFLIAVQVIPICAHKFLSEYLPISTATLWAILHGGLASPFVKTSIFLYKLLLDTNRRNRKRKYPCRYV